MLAAMQSNLLDPNGHRILVSFATGDRGDLMYLRYTCEDPTCDWCITEFGPDECKEIAKITDELLTHYIYNVKSQEGGATHATPKARKLSTQLTFEDNLK